MSDWIVPPLEKLPEWYEKTVELYTPNGKGKHAARLLWCRGIREKEQIREFLDINAYIPRNPFEFGEEMHLAVTRLKQARERGEKVTIWGDFDADGITATGVLMEGLGQFFTPYLQLDYYIPDRLTESHGLNIPGIDRLSERGTGLIVTCDTGSTNIDEINHAKNLGIDIIVTDHHTLPTDRPDLIALINPRYFDPSHPLYHLSGVAVAYKLVEALYLTLPDIPVKPLEDLLDLVAIGLIADLVQLTGECRYLARKGIEKLGRTERPGVVELLRLCKINGNRPTDISFGIGPRINAISRIEGKADPCVELLTGTDKKRCLELARRAESVNTRRREIQENSVKQIRKKIARIDLSTTPVIILDDPGWPAGILGLVAGQIAREYNRPTVLLNSGNEDGLGLARGSARSILNIDLYKLLSSQSHLLHRFGGHPLAAGLSLKLENLPLFVQGINQRFRHSGIDINSLTPLLEIDLEVTVSELGMDLFKELKLLEPCGMGNPAPKLLVRKCRFRNIKPNNFYDGNNKRTLYPRTNFILWDETEPRGIEGLWWGHHRDDLSPDILYDAAIELDFNPRHDRYEVRIIDLRPHENDPLPEHSTYPDTLLDWRNRPLETGLIDANLELLLDCPDDWGDLSREYLQASLKHKPLALAYSSPDEIENKQIWSKLVGIAKYLLKTGDRISRKQLKLKLGLNDRTLTLGLQALSQNGIDVKLEGANLIFLKGKGENGAAVELFLEALAEERFRKKYFASVPVEVLKNGLKDSTLEF